METSTTLTTVIAALRERETVGLGKYGKTVDRDDYTPLTWANHAQTEAMDLILYLERCKPAMQMLSEIATLLRGSDCTAITLHNWIERYNKLFAVDTSVTTR